LSVSVKALSVKAFPVCERISFGRECRAWGAATFLVGDDGEKPRRKQAT
jgi:hypothetical protein